MRNNEYAQRMTDSSLIDPRAEYQRNISSDWRRPFEMSDSTAQNDSTPFADGAHDGADVEITFADHIAIAHGSNKARLARQAATKSATDDATHPRKTYVQQLGDKWGAA